MQLVPEAKDWHRLWSVRLFIIGAVLGWLEVILPAWEGIIPDGVFGILSATVVSLGPLVRLIKQGLHHE